MTNPLDSIGIALSGGGLRASSFHLGVLKWLAEHQLFEKVSCVSSVSGGTLLVALIYNFNNYRWPNSVEFADKVFPQIYTFLGNYSIVKEAFKQIPKHPLHLYERSRLIQSVLENRLMITEKLSNLPTHPEWVINATTHETGRRFYFTSEKMGDKEFGYSYSPDLSLAFAVTSSLAYPGFIGPSTIKVSKYKWQKENARDYIPPFSKLHIYDGGIYDNLGLEAFIDIKKDELRNSSKSNFIIAVDAGAPLSKSRTPWYSRWKKLYEISSEQSRLLMIRAYVNYLKSTSRKGIYIQIGAEPKHTISKFAPSDIKEELLRENWLDENAINSAKLISTGLSPFPKNTLDLLIRHGYETVKFNATIWFKQPTNQN